MTEKEYIRADDLVRDAFSLAHRIYESGYVPDVLLVLWRGGTPVGIVVHEFLLYKGIDTYHTVVKAVSYQGIGRRVAPQLESFDSVLGAIDDGAHVLVIDDIFDTGCTVREVYRRLTARTTNVKVATLYVKAGANQTEIVPDFHLRKTSKWIVFPHELMDLTREEIMQKDPFVHDLLG
jgi:uncharacterized protein